MDHSATRRRNLVVVPSKGTPPLDLEPISIKSCLAYTSLKDVLSTASAVSSPTAAAPTPTAAADISIRNRLVKHAAWAYLQPMAASPSYSASGYFHRLRSEFSAVTACLSFIVPAVTWLLRSLGIQITR